MEAWMGGESRAGLVIDGYGIGESVYKNTDL